METTIPVRATLIHVKTVVSAVHTEVLMFANVQLAIQAKHVITTPVVLVMEEAVTVVVVMHRHRHRHQLVMETIIPVLAMEIHVKMEDSVYLMVPLLFVNVNQAIQVKNVTVVMVVELPMDRHTREVTKTADLLMVERVARTAVEVMVDAIQIHAKTAVSAARTAVVVVITMEMLCVNVHRVILAKVVAQVYMQMVTTKKVLEIKSLLFK